MKGEGNVQLRTKLGLGSNTLVSKVKWVAFWEFRLLYNNEVIFLCLCSFISNSILNKAYSM